MTKAKPMHVLNSWSPEENNFDTVFLPCNKTFYSAYTHGHCVGTMVVIRTLIDRKNGSKYYTHYFNLDGINYKLLISSDGVDESSKGYISILIQNLSKESGKYYFDFTFDYGAKHSSTFSMTDSMNQQAFGVAFWKHWNDIKSDTAKITIAFRSSEKVEDQVNEVVAIQLDDKKTPQDELFGQLTLSKLDDHVCTGHYDVIIKGNDWELFTHKEVLCQNSPVFRQMFHHDTPERSKCQIEIVDFDRHVIKALLNFMNTGRIYFTDTPTMLEIVKAAEKYMMDDLKSSCEHLLLFHINENSLADLAILSTNLRMNILKGACYYIMKIYFQTFVLTKDWEKIGNDPETIVGFTRSLAGTMAKKDWTIKNQSPFNLYDDVNQSNVKTVV